MIICRVCHEEQEIVLRGEVEVYEHEGRCPACGEYVSCVSSCIAEDTKENRMKKTITLHHDKETKGTNRFTVQGDPEERVVDSIYIRKPFFANSDEITITIEDEKK